MTEKSGIAQFLDKLAEGLAKSKDQKQSSDGSDIFNVLPKPKKQEINDGLISWEWETKLATISAYYATSNTNSMKMTKNSYVVSVNLASDFAWIINGEEAKELGQAILSASRWEHIWKIHAGEFLVEDLPEECNNVKIVPEIVPEINSSDE